MWGLTVTVHVSVDMLINLCVRVDVDMYVSVDL